MMARVLGVLRTLHAWTGAVVALVMIVTGLTGSLLVLKSDWLRLTIPEARANVPATPAVLGAAADKLEHFHHGELRRLVFAGPQLGLHQAFFAPDHYAYARADGTVITEWTGDQRAETVVYDLHHFLLAGDTGMKVVGFSALVVVFLALSGVIVWLPLWRSFRARAWPASGQRRDLLSFHRNLGVMFAVPVVVFCLTGAGLIFYKTTGAWLTKALPGPEAEEFFPPAHEADVDWPAAMASAQARFPKARIRMARWPQSAMSPAVVRMKQPGEWAPDGSTDVMIDPASSKVIAVIEPSQIGRGLRLNAALYPVHTATVGGRLYDLVAFASGVALAALGGFGLWSFVVKPRRWGRRAA